MNIEYPQTRLKKPRGMAQASLDLIEAMRVIAETMQPITGRGLGYKLFTAGLTPDMSNSTMWRVYRLLKIAREEGTIPWEWIVDETRELERVATWDDPEEYARCVARSYRRDFWNQQPVRVEVWSEKGTVRGVLKPVLDHYAVGFRVLHGFGSATTIYDIAQTDDSVPLHVIYVGDLDPSGLYMSEQDLPDRLSRYGGHHIRLQRVALLPEQVLDLPSFDVSSKTKDTRYKWFTGRYGNQCWELDAMNPNTLRNCVENAIRKQIDPIAWNRCEVVNKAELESLRTILSGWKR